MGEYSIHVRVELPRPVEDGDSQTKKILDISLEFFYCTVVPTICNPLFRMFMAALWSRWWCVWQCGHSQFLMCKFCFPLIFLFLFWHLLHICVDGQYLYIFTNVMFSCLHFCSSLFRKSRGAFSCMLWLKSLSVFQEIMFSF